MPEHTQGTSTTVLGTRRYRSGTSAHGCYAPQPECQPQIFGRRVSGFPAARAFRHSACCS